jgi:hypothetical protein
MHYDPSFLSYRQVRMLFVLSFYTLVSWLQLSSSHIPSNLRDSGSKYIIKTVITLRIYIYTFNP